MLYGICGKKRSGKDTVANFMTEKEGVQPIALARSLKQFLYDAAEKHFSGPIYDLYLYQMFDADDKKETPLVISNKDVREFFYSALETLHSLGYSTITHTGVFDEVKQNKTIWTPRRLMQVFGTDVVCNSYGNHVWFSETMKNILLMSGDGVKDIVITDIRQPHEYKYLKLLGGTVIHVDRDTGYDDTHSTESGLPIQEGDIVIDNNGTLEELKQKVINILH